MAPRPKLSSLEIVSFPFKRLDLKTKTAVTSQEFLAPPPKLFVGERDVRTNFLTFMFVYTFL